MKSNAPWSVKGIERDARETAKEAARREGMTVGEWLNQMIYTAGEGESSGGDVQGLRARDLVTAIEHLKAQLSSADETNGKAAADLTRNMGKLVERIQRLERVKPAEGSTEDLAGRVEKLEANRSDRSRIEALQALEKAVSQVAVQFTTSHQASLKRIETTETHLQALEARLGEPAPSGAETSAITELKGEIEGLSARIAHAERAAPTADGADGGENATSGDLDFVEQTSARLRILGEEIKRGGDQIRTLETTIAKLSEQIDAAERRSSEGVQKVAETILDLKQQFASADEQDNDQQRADIEAVVAEATRETEQQLATLQTSFNSMITRLEALDAGEIPTSDTPSGAQSAKSSEVDAVDGALFDAHGDASQIEDDEIGADVDVKLTLDPPAHGETISGPGAQVDETEPQAEDEDDGFGFELDDDEAFAPQGESDSDNEPGALLAEIKSALGETEDPATDAANADETGISGERDEELDAILADLEAITDDEPEGAAAAGGAEDDHQAGETSQAEEAVAAGEPAPESADDAATSAQRPTRRQLTPKQKAILAARARRKRLAAIKADEAEKAAEESTAAAPTQDEADQDALDADSDGSSIDDGSTKRAGLSGLIAGLGKRGKKTEEASDDASVPDTDSDGANAPETLDDTGALNEAEDSAAISSTKSAAVNRPVTIALGVGIVLSIAALFFLMKDLVLKPSDPVTTSQVTPSPTQAQRTAIVPSATTTESAPVETIEVPAAPTVNPRDLYQAAMAALNTAQSDAETTAAISKLEDAAALGHPPAQLQLGELYKLGQGLEQDLGQARTWFRRAANGGNVLAMHRVGVMTARGDGGLADAREAIGWFELAAQRGLVDSQYNLGAIYHPSGDNGPSSNLQDAGKAYYWYSLAAKNGDAQAAPLAVGIGATLGDAQRQSIDSSIAGWVAESSDPIANELDATAG